MRRQTVATTGLVILALRGDGERGTEEGQWSHPDGQFVGAVVGNHPDKVRELIDGASE